VRFSVIIAVYNGAEYVRQAIDSVLSQTFEDYELIVVDDGSTDRTWDVLQSYGTQIITLHQVNQGPEAAHKLAVSAASGDYLALLDHDDLFLPWTLGIYDRVIRAFELPSLILGSMTYFAEGKDLQADSGRAGIVEVLKYQDFLAKGVGTSVSSSKIVIKKSVFKEATRLRDRLKDFPFNDYHLLLLAGTYGPCVIVKRPTTVAYRRHVTNMSRNIEAMTRGVFSLIRAERAGWYPGGRARRFARYARIGGPVYEWSKKAFKRRLRGLALRLLISGLPMVVAAILRKSAFAFQRTSVLTVSKGCQGSDGPIGDRETFE
jgi:glycosyltransferase involved in cell wall biosynthesis